MEEIATHRAAAALVRNENPAEYLDMAVKRGTRRAAVEMALHLVADNLEQYRPGDRFRKAFMSVKPRPPMKEVPLCRALEHLERPAKLDTLNFTKVMRAYRQWKDQQHYDSRQSYTSQNANSESPPSNYLGPFTLASEKEAKARTNDRNNRMIFLRDKLAEAQKLAPRPLLHHVLALIERGIFNEVPRDGSLEEATVSVKDLSRLMELARPSWENRPEIPPMTNDPEDWPSDQNLIDNYRRQNDFDRDVDKVLKVLPLWDPVLRSHNLSEDITMLTDEEAVLRLSQRPYDESPSRQGMPVDDFIHVMNCRILNKTSRSPWTNKEGMQHLRVLHKFGRIQ